MYTYILRRLCFGALTVFGVSIIVFLIMRVMPGDPLTAIFGPDGMTKLTEAQRMSYMRELGLTDPLIVQYFKWLGDIVTGELGRSFFRAESVGEMVLRRGSTIEPGTKVLVVEDVLTTGGSAKEVLRVLKELGADVVAVGSILNRSGGNPFEEFGLPLYCLAEAEVQTWEPATCPLCAAGTGAIKPGSRTQAACTGEAAGGAS